MKVKKGYVFIMMPNHHRSDSQGYVREHILIAEKALGKPLRLPHVIHHYTPKQIVICENQAYHQLLHQRQRALQICGHANWLRCSWCKKYDNPKNLSIKQRSDRPQGQMRSEHRECRNNYGREHHIKKKLRAAQLK